MIGLDEEDMEDEVEEIDSHITEKCGGDENELLEESENLPIFENDDAFDDQDNSYLTTEPLSLCESIDSTI